MIMLWMFTLLLEATLHTVPVFWHKRNVVIFVLIPLIGFSSGMLLFALPKQLSAVLGVFTIYRVLNLLRIIQSRMHEKYLRRATRNTFMWLCGIGVTSSLVLYISSVYSHILGLRELVYIQSIVALGLLIHTVYRLRMLRFPKLSSYRSDNELPTVTVAIPARNETADLPACLESLLKNDYPKLEIIVLDDCSYDKTDLIIKDFAHQGVRFIKGNNPSPRWLAKNQAYERLLNESNGEIILFCGVDARFGRTTIRTAINYMLSSSLTMISVLPKRKPGARDSVLVQPMRYWWELALPRQLFHRPAVLSTCWFIKTKELRSFGGFASLSQTILPEGHLARYFDKGNQYQFVASGNDLDVTTTKSLSEQKDTAIRMRYPQVRRRPELQLLVVLAECGLLLLPFVIAARGLILSYQPWTLLSVISCVLLVASHVVIVSASYPGNVLLALCNFPFVVITELYLATVSMLRYEFGSVSWKERNICLPVMHAIPHLPPADIKKTS